MITNQSLPPLLLPFLPSLFPNSTDYHQSRCAEKFAYKAKEPGLLSSGSAVLLATIEGADASDLAGGALGETDISPLLGACPPAPQPLLWNHIRATFLGERLPLS